MDKIEKIKAIMIEKGINQAHLAELCGLRCATISHIFSGRRPLNPDLLSKIVNALSVEVEKVDDGVSV